ncbi:MAG: succinylglutamate desuccinylase/aspartoacylase family protein, partial [Bdellovibrionales bacterium]|nr:succinylglutamate desuccinylase/aspartoacylase family protein [Bdellovibrionales bacterium]
MTFQRPDQSSLSIQSPFIEADFCSALRGIDPSEIVDVMLDQADLRGALRQGTIERLPIPGAWRIRSGKPGMQTMVLGGVHGNEFAGVYTIIELIKDFANGDLQLERGQVVLAFGSPQAISSNTRGV